jgi:tetratricopeptide (TPR) repeat protein
MSIHAPVVMVSSTMIDLPDHRKEVLAACLQQGMFPKMMEHLPASPDQALTASLKMVDEADVYVGVFAHRYGFVPSGFDLSITEAEYNRAAARGIPLLVFIMNDSHLVKACDVEKGAGAQKLEILKARLKKENTVNFFASPEDLRALVVNSLSQSAARLALQPQSSAAVENYSADKTVFFVPYRAKGDRVVGRTGPLTLLRNQLTAGNPTAIGQTASFQGLGGLGKTQLAVEYAYEFKADYPNGVIWLSADQDVEAQLTDLARTARWVAPQSEHKDKLAVARQRIRTYSNALLIFDNVDNFDAIAAFLPEPSAKPHIIITSRLEIPGFVPVAVDLLSDELALKMLFLEAGRKPESQADLTSARELVELLGGLPLALELAGAYLRNRPVSWTEYAAITKENLSRALPERFLAGSFTKHEADIFSSLRVHQQILHEYPILRSILDLLTWSGSGSMGLPLMGYALGITSISELKDALGLAVALRLLQRTSDDERYSMHRLVREVRRTEEPGPEIDWMRNVAERVVAWFVERKRNFADLVYFEGEIHHLVSWQQNAKKISARLTVKLIWLQGYPPFHRGKYEEAKRWLEAALSAYQTGALDDPELKANLLSDLCTIHTNLGELPLGIACGEESLTIRLATLGGDHPDTAMTMNNLGATYRLNGPLDKSLALADQALRVWQKAYGDNHIDTALALGNVGATYAEMGELEKAFNFRKRSLDARIKVLGTLHPDTAIGYAELGDTYRRKRDFKKALESEEMARDLVNQIAGPDSVQMASVYQHFGNIHVSSGELKLALSFLTQAYELRWRLLGERSLLTAVSLTDLVVANFLSGRLHHGWQLLDSYISQLPHGHGVTEWCKNKRKDYAKKFPRPGFRQVPKRR